LNGTYAADGWFGAEAKGAGWFMPEFLIDEEEETGGGSTTAVMNTNFTIMVITGDSSGTL
jgi:hypothetical protein